MKSASFTTLTLDLCSFEAAVWCTGSGLLSRLQSAQSLCETLAAQQPAGGEERGEIPLQSGAPQHVGPCTGSQESTREAAHSQLGKSNRTGGQNATPISTRGHWTAAGRGPGTVIIIILLSPGPGLHTGTELKQNQQR